MPRMPLSYAQTGEALSFTGYLAFASGALWMRTSRCRHTRRLLPLLLCGPAMPYAFGVLQLLQLEPDLGERRRQPRSPTT